MNNINNWRKTPTRKLIVSLVLATVALVALVLMVSSRSASAQPGGDIYVDKQLGRPSPVVYVGEYLTFTIFIRNDSPFTVTTLPLSTEGFPMNAS